MISGSAALRSQRALLWLLSPISSFAVCATPVHHVVQVTAQAAAARARVTIDAGAHMFPATMLWPVREPNGMLISNGLSTMGFALPAAIGAALLDPGRTGDCLDRRRRADDVRGGAPHRRPRTSPRHRHRLQRRVAQPHRHQAAAAPVRVVRRVARQRRLGCTGRSFGAAAHVASTESELERALAQALDHRGPSLIEARIDPSTYGETLHTIRG
jgi:acetolactate synthase-1/2/3 large subunit